MKPRRLTPDEWKREVETTEDFLRTWARRPEMTVHEFKLANGMPLHALASTGEHSLVFMVFREWRERIRPPRFKVAYKDGISTQFYGTYRNLAKYIVKHGGIGADAFSRLVLERGQ